MPVVTAVDVLSVQRYVFASNRLRDVIAASWLVDRATSKQGALQEWSAHILMAAGANAILEFDGLEQAQDFAARYTRRLVDDAPGLEVAIVHREYTAGGLAEALRALQGDLARAKLERIPSAEQLGVSVTPRCHVTGLPAAGVDINGRPASEQVLRWREVKRQAEARWGDLLANEPQRFFPVELDQMGRSRGDTSLLGVVHVDGNGIGDGIACWLKELSGKPGARAEAAPDVELRRQYRDWSKALDDLVQGALKAVVDRVCGAAGDGTKIAGAIPRLSFDLYKDEKIGQCALPLRPVLAGGDDLTFICDGRIALDLAATALRALESRSLPHLGRISGCAGVALVPAHHPFVRAYEMAESLCGLAKAKRREKKDGGSWIDWQVGPSRPGEPVAVARRRTLRVKQDGTTLDLTCRPYCLGEKSATGPAFDGNESWRWLSETVLGADAEGRGLRGPVWMERRNKVKALGPAAREGPEAVKALLAAWKTVDEQLALPAGLDDGYLHGARTPLLDAVELLDLHLPLDQPTVTVGKVVPGKVAS